MNKKFLCWNIYLRGRLIDSVYFLISCDHDYVKNSLINHDFYHPNIVLNLSKEDRELYKQHRSSL